MPKWERRRPSGVRLCLAIIVALGVAEGRFAARTAPSQDIDISTSGRIRGVVLDATSGRPLRSANVRLVSVADAFERLTVSDSSGRFEFVALPAGQFGLHATKAGYLPVRGDPAASADTSRLALGAGQNLDGVEVALLPASAISGVIRDSTGDPVGGARVRALALSEEAGLPALRLVSAVARTDSRGRFRIPNLAAGDYFIEARRSQLPDGLGLVPAPTFYPAAGTLSEARAIHLETARTFEIEVWLTSTPIVQVEGKALDAEGRPLSGVVQARQLLGTQLVPVASSFIAADGSFRIANVAAGTYVLRTTPITTSVHPQVASMTIDARTDRSGIDLVAQRMAWLTGRVEAEGVAANAFRPPLRVGIAPALIGLPPPTTFGDGVVNADMTFALAVEPGAALIRVNNLPAHWVVADIFIDGVDATNAAVRLLPGTEHTVVLRLSTRATTFPAR